MTVAEPKAPALTWRVVRQVSGRLSWGLSDQVLSTLTNFLLTTIVARTLGAAEFGAFSLAYVTYGLAINTSRGLSIEPLLIRFSGTDAATWRRAASGSADTAFLTGLAGGACAAGAGAVIGGTTGLAFIALGITLPGLLLQDSWRYAFFAAGRGHHAFVNDAAWTVVQIPALIGLKLSGHASVFWFVMAWGGAAVVAAALGCLQSRVRPSLAGAVRWLRGHRDLGPRYVVENTGSNLTDMARSYGVSNILGLAAVGDVNAASVPMGPFRIIFLGVGMITIPEAARILRRSPRHLPLFCAGASAVLTLLALAWTVFLLIALPRGLGHLMLGALWRPAYPLVLPSAFCVMAMCAATGPGIGMHALGASRRSMRASVAGTVLVVVSALAGAELGGTEGTVRFVAAAAWAGVAISWFQFRRALRESGHGRPGHFPDHVLNLLTMRSDEGEPGRTFIERARRQQLVTAAIDQLAEAGYAGTTLAAVAARAGLSKPAVLYHFTGGKDELLGEVVDTVLGDATATMTEAIRAQSTVPDRLRAYITSNVAFLAGHRREILAVLAIFNGSGPRPDGSSPWEPISERVVTELAGLLRTGQDAGAFGAFSPMVVARSVRGAIDALEPVLRHRPETDLDAYAGELAAIFEKVTAP